MFLLEVSIWDSNKEFAVEGYAKKVAKIREVALKAPYPTALVMSTLCPMTSIHEQVEREEEAEIHTKVWLLVQAIGT